MNSLEDKEYHTVDLSPIECKMKTNLLNVKI